MQFYSATRFAAAISDRGRPCI